MRTIDLVGLTLEEAIILRNGALKVAIQLAELGLALPQRGASLQPDIDRARNLMDRLDADISRVALCKK
jgi:hypothetical protein